VRTEGVEVTGDTLQRQGASRLPCISSAIKRWLQCRCVQERAGRRSRPREEEEEEEEFTKIHTPNEY
jgi:hypothetical protein